jgi:hypothetical protein
MAKVEIKTIENEVSVIEFINTVEDESKRKDSIELVKIMEEITKSPAKMWGPAIIRFRQIPLQIRKWPRSRYAKSRFFAEKRRHGSLYWGQF